MIQGYGLDPELVLHPGDALRKFGRLDLSSCKGFARMKLCRLRQDGTVVIHDLDAEIDRVLVQQVPGEAPDPVLDLRGKARWADEGQREGAVKAQPEQSVEPGHVVHMGVRN